MVDQAANFIDQNIEFDNPATSRGDTDWLKEKVGIAENSMKKNDPRTASGKGLVGATTASASVNIPVNMLNGLKGAYDERREKGVRGFDNLFKKVKKEGWNPDPISVAINHKGQPYIYEGNTRVAIANSLGIPSIPAKIHWLNGAENTPGDWHVENFANKMLSSYTHKADGGDVDGITAYHGSPHEFDQFDTSKIGTGEGAQAYGHGLYFAEHEPVAKGYRDKLTSMIVGGARRKLSQSGNDVDAAISKIQGEKERLKSLNLTLETGSENRNRMINFQNDYLNELHNYKNTGQMNQGHMYEVHIDAHPDHFLNWDKPLSEQSPHIVKSIFDARKDNPTLFNVFKPHLEKDSTGMGFYQSLATQHPNGYQGATDFLQRAGIPGIRYLDAGSRNAQGDPTHNYVVFDHNRVNVKRKYEQGGFIRRAYQKGGKVEGSVWNDKDADVNYRGLTNSPIVQHALDKIAAPLPASILHQGSVTGRRH